MQWKEVGAKIATAAPLIGSFFGPAGLAIGTGVKLLSSILGIPEAEVTPENVDTLLTGNPENLIKLKEFELKNRELILGYFLKTQEMELQDVANARMMHVETTRSTGKRDINLYVLAWVIIGGFIGLIGGLIAIQLIWEKTLQTDPLLTMLLGSLSTDAGMVVGYFFGSSKSSADKTQLLANLKGP